MPLPFPELHKNIVEPKQMFEDLDIDNFKYFWEKYFEMRDIFFDFSVGNNTTVISVRGSGASRDNTEADKSNGAVSSREGRDFKERTSSFATDSDVENPVS